MYFFVTIDKYRCILIEIISKENISIFLYNLKVIINELLENKCIVNKSFELGDNSIYSCDINNIIDIMDFKNYKLLNVKEFQNILSKYDTII